MLVWWGWVCINRSTVQPSFRAKLLHLKLQNYNLISVSDIRQSFRAASRQKVIKNQFQRPFATHTISAKGCDCDNSLFAFRHTFVRPMRTISSECCASPKTQLHFTTRFCVLCVRQARSPQRVHLAQKTSRFAVRLASGPQDLPRRSRFVTRLAAAAA